MLIKMEELFHCQINESQYDVPLELIKTLGQWQQRRQPSIHEKDVSKSKGPRKEILTASFSILVYF
jgi:hypothetical protein